MNCRAVVTPERDGYFGDGYFGDGYFVVGFDRAV